MAIKYANKNDLIRFSITVTEAKINHITKEDLSGITEIISNEKYRIFISNGFKKDGSRNRITETFNGTLLEAIARKKAIKEEIKQKVITADNNSTFEEFTKLYIQYLEEKVHNKQLELTTYHEYCRIINSYILTYFDNMIISSINERTVETWINKLSTTPNKSIVSKYKGKFIHKTTIAHSYKLLNNMFNFAKLERILRENPCEFVKKKPTEAPDEKEYFSLEEMDYIKQLLLTANIRLRTAMYLILDSGCRREEACGLKWKDIDFENNTIDINKAVVATNTKSSLTDERVFEKGVKSKHSLRRIGLPNATINALKQYRIFKEDSGMKVKEDDWVFTNWDSNKVLDPNRLTSDWYMFRKANNIKKDVSVHGLRHSNATYLLSLNIPEKDVAKRLGHTPEVLSRTYTHSNENDDKKIVDRIEQNFYRNKKKFSLNSIVSVISGNIDNEYKNENYKLLDYLTNDNVTSNNLEIYLLGCQRYLLKKFPILDSFAYNDVANNKKVFNEKIENYKNFLGETIEIIEKPEDKIFKNLNL